MKLKQKFIDNQLFSPSFCAPLPTILPLSLMLHYTLTYPHSSMLHFPLNHPIYNLSLHTDLLHSSPLRGMKLRSRSSRLCTSMGLRLSSRPPFSCSWRQAINATLCGTNTHGDMLYVHNLRTYAGTRQPTTHIRRHPSAHCPHTYA